MSQLSEVSGRVQLTLHGPRGEVNGAMLDDGTVLRLPPPEAARLASLLAPGQTVVADGVGFANNLGRVVDVRALGSSRDALVPVEGPPGPRGRRGPPPPPPPGAAPVAQP